MKFNRVALKNFIFLMVAAPIGTAINFLITILIARYLKSEGFGFYSKLISFISITIVLIEASRTVIIRNIAQEPDKLFQIFTTTKAMLWLLSLVIFTGLMGLSFFNTDGNISLVTYFTASIGAIFMFHARGYGLVFIATERMEFNGVGTVAHKMVALLFVSIVLLTRPTLNRVFIAIAAANFSLWAFYWLVFKKQYGTVSVPFEYKKLIDLLKEVMIVGSAAIVRRLSWNVDIILLSVISTAEATGFFNGAYNLIHSLNMIPWIATVVLFPMISRMAITDEAKLIKLTYRLIALFCVCIIPVIIVSYFYVNHIILFLLGSDYGPSVEVMRILIWDIFFSFPISFLFYIFVALGIQRIYLFAMGISIIINTICDLVLIPQYGPVGAAVGSLSADVICFFVLIAGLIFRGGYSGKRGATGLLRVDV